MSMKSKSRVLASLALGLAVLGSSQAQADMVAYWNFDSNVNDSVNANIGTIHGSVPYVTGQFGDATSYNKNNANYVTVPSSASLNDIASGFTLSIWVNAPTSNGTNNGDPLSKWPGTGGRGYGLHNSPANTWYTGNASYIGVAAGTFNNGTWRNLVLRWNGTTTLTSYMDGVQVATTPLTSASGNTATLVFGNDNRGLPNPSAAPYGGLLDDVALFNGTNLLTVAQTQSIYNVGSSTLGYSMADMNLLFTLYANAAGTTTTSDGKTWQYNADGLTGAAGTLVGSGPDYSVIFSDTGTAGVSVIPEPATLGLLAIGSMMIAFRERRK